MLERTTDLSTVIEGTYGQGTPETTTFTKGHYLFGSGSFYNVETDKRSLSPLRKSLTKTAPSATGRSLVNLTPQFDLIGHGGDPEDYRWGLIMRACGFKETTDVGNNRVDYLFRSDGFESLAVSVFQAAVSGGSNGLLRRSTGVVGSFSMSGAAGEEIVIKTQLKGLYVAPVQQAEPTVTYPTGGAVVHTMKNEGLTIVGSFGTITPIWKSFEFNAGYTTVERKDANAPEALKGLRLTKRDPTLKLVLELDSDDLISYFAAHRLGAGDPHTIHWIHGPGNTEQVEFRMVGQLAAPTEQSQDDLRTIELNYDLFHPTADDYECQIGAI
jgi:hypothetical protein